MQRALELAREQLGRVWPNPSVGCVIVRDNKIVGEGVTQDGGRPHAETMALAEAGHEAAGATAFVTLEPCSHTGKTPPCAQALIQAGIERCVVALADPDPRVDGQGIELMTVAGIDVDIGLHHEEAAELNEGFFELVQKGVPKVYPVDAFDRKFVERLDAVFMPVRTYLDAPSDWENANLLLLAVRSKRDLTYLLDRMALVSPSAWIVSSLSGEKLLERFETVVEVGGLKRTLLSSAVLRRLGETGITRLGVVDLPTSKTVSSA